jgi:hypothetical protein
MTKPDEALLGIGSAAFALSAVWVYVVDTFFKDASEIQTKLMGKSKYENDPGAAGDRAKKIKHVQRTPAVVLWIAGLVLSILAFT